MPQRAAECCGSTLSTGPYRNQWLHAILGALTRQTRCSAIAERPRCRVCYSLINVSIVNTEGRKHIWRKPGADLHRQCHWHSIGGFVEFNEVVRVCRRVLRSTAVRWIVRSLSHPEQVSRRLQRCSNEPRRAVVRRRQQVRNKWRHAILRDLN